MQEYLIMTHRHAPQVKIIERLSMNKIKIDLNNPYFPVPLYPILFYHRSSFYYPLEIANP